MKKVVLALVVAVLLVGSVALVVAAPVRDVSHKHHPNLAAAQRLAHQAFEKIIAAQRANEWDLQGHAQKAKELLDQVNIELKAAAEASNDNAGK